MRLKTLEIKGFKSFANKATVHFNDDITGIVGPNGCGKSNVIDSIRWVLGEQKTRSLRLDKMESVIFNGTKDRKQAGAAEVSLTFENNRGLLPTEFSSVNITRTLYRTGDSEYRLNGVTCRLKDISGLLMDTGISSDSYAIIELSKIGDILSNKDNIRKKMIDQAAGITKFKKRKRETENKLKGTNADLERVEDLLHEIEGNLVELEKQAKKANRYNKNKAKYRQFSVDLAIMSLKDFKEASGNLGNLQKAQQDRRNALEEEVTNSEQTLLTAKEDIQSKEEELGEAQRNFNQHLSSLQKTENEKNVLTEQRKFLLEKKERLELQIKHADENISSLEKEVNSLNAKLGSEEGILLTIKTELEEFRTKTNEVREKYEAEQKELQHLETAHRSVEKQAYELEKNIAIKTTQRENLIKEQHDHTIQSKDRKESLIVQKQRLEEKDGLKLAAETLLEELMQKEEVNQATIQEKQNKLNELSDEFNRKVRERDVKQNEYKLTKSLVDNLEGYPDSIKFLKNHPEWKTDATLLSEIVDCPDEYKVIIENYFGERLNYYVVDSTEKAFEGVYLLNNNDKGKGQFFINDEVSQVENFYQSIPNAIAANSIIKVENKYKKLVHFLLRDVFIIDDAQTSQFDVNQFPSATFLTKSGIFIRRKAWISGGSIGAFEGKRIGRIQQLQELSEEVEQLNELIAAMKEQRNQLKSDLADLKSKSSKKAIAEQQRAYNRLVNESISITAKLENTQILIEQNESRDSGLTDRIEELGKSADILKEELAAKQDEQKESAGRRDEFKTIFEETSVQLNALRQEFNQRNIEYHKQQNQLNSIVQSLEFKSNDIKKTQNTLQSNKTELTQGIQNIDNIESQINQVTESLKELYETKDDMANALKETEQAYNQAKSNVEIAEQTLRNAEKARQQIESELGDIKEQMNNQKMDVLSMKERLNIEFGIDVNDVINEEPSGEITDLEELKIKVLKLRKRLENYGPINSMAVEAYEEMKTRYDFIINQRQDLLDAQTSLLETMKEIETSASEKFMTAFNQVKENFTDVFQSLFNPGDSCDLRLSIPDNPLEADIQIIAKPKGKRPQTIDQLSGGEKSLTALALIFSLYLLKPAPFCILDEVDAPLDDANIDKFNAIIRRFSEHSQFIIVTHNKNTMASTDVIYGVTMAELGVSSLVPVDFRDLGYDGAVKSVKKTLEVKAD